MADKKQLAILKKGVKTWNDWRKKDPDNYPDLRGANLRAISLSGANLSKVYLSEANLYQVHLHGVDLREAILREANLGNAYLREANLRQASFFKADLHGAYMVGAYLRGTSLRGANIREANLSEASLFDVELDNADLSGTRVGWTDFGDVDLSTAIGLETLIHDGPSYVGINTVYRSKGNIPESFLRKAGVPENLITFMHSLTGKAFEFYSCFISHSARDKRLCERLYADLQARGVRTWYFPEDAKWGESVWGEIDRSIKVYDKLVVVLSENSLQSGPVLREIERALNREDKEGKNILFPIRIDDYIFNGWEHERKPDVLRKVVGDFSGWDKDAAKYEKVFDKLLKGLQAESTKA